MMGAGGWASRFEDGIVPMTIGFLDENGSDEYHSTLLEGIAESAAAHQVRLVRIGHFISNDTERDPVQVKMLHRFTSQFKFDGLLFLGWHRAVNLENLASFRSRFQDVPLFSIGSVHEGIPAAYFDGGPYVEELILHLVNHHQRKRIAFVAPFTPDGRADCYQRVMLQHGLSDPLLFVQETLMEGLPVPERGKRAVQILLDERNAGPDAIISLYNIETEGILKELSGRGIRVPEDISVTSYEDGEVGRYASPSYTTVLFPWRELGRVSCDLFLSRLKQKRENIREVTDTDPSQGTLSGSMPMEVKVPGQMIIRESCGCGGPAAVGIREIQRPAKSLLDMSEREWRTLADAAGEVVRRTGLQRPDFHLLMRGFLRGLQTGNRSLFLREMEAQLDFFEHAGTATDPAPILDALRNAVLPHVERNTGMLLAAEDMFLQAHALLAERTLKAWGSREGEVKRVNRLLELCGQKIISQYTLKQLTDTLGESLEMLGIPDCLVILFDTRQNAKDRYARCTPVFYQRKGVRADESMMASGTAREILEIISPEVGPGCALANLLHVGRMFHGFVIYGPGPMDERVYRALSYHISTALSGIFQKDRLERSFKRLVDNAHKEGMSHAASGILHNIRNVLGSVEATAFRMQETVQASPLGDLRLVADMLGAQDAELEGFLESDPRAAKLVRFLLQMQPALENYDKEIGMLSDRLREKNRLIREILATRRMDRPGGGMAESCDMVSLIEEAVELDRPVLEAQAVQVVYRLQGSFVVKLTHAKMVHVLLNLVKNARESMSGTPETDRVLTIELIRSGRYGEVRIRDRGEGIPTDRLTTIFSHGYTTKKGGHGYGLHASANDIVAMGGTIRAESAGPGRGACFVLTLPIWES